MDKKKFLQTLAQNQPFWERKPIYDYSKSPDENVEMGSAMETNINYMPEDEWKKKFGEMYVRKQEGDPESKPLPVENTQDEMPITPRINSIASKPQPTSVAPAQKLTVQSLDEILKGSKVPSEVPEAKSSVDLASLLNSIPKEVGNDELAKAQRERQDMLSKLLFARGANKIGASIAGVDADKDYLSELGNRADLAVTDAKDRAAEKQKIEEINRARRNQGLSEINAQETLNNQAFNRSLQKQDQELQLRNQAITEAKTNLDLKKAQMEIGNAELENDGNSEISKTFRQYAKELVSQSGLNVTIPESASYAQLSKQMGVLSNVITTKMAQDARKEMAAEKKADRDLRSSELKNEKSGKFLNQVDQEIKRSDAYKSVKKLNAVQRGIQNAMLNPSSQADIDVLYNFVKLLDQESAVREGEIGLAQQALSIQEKLKVEMSRLGNKPRILSDKFIRDVNNLVGVYSKLSQDQYGRELKTKRSIAERIGIPKEEFDATFKDLFDSGVTNDDLNGLSDDQLDAELNKLKGN